MGTLDDMIVGMGMDLVEIARVEAFVARWGERGLGRLYADDEIAYCLGQAVPAPALAARFAAKEAFFKAVGTGWGGGGDWVDVAVSRLASGAPELRVRGRAASALEAAGAQRAHLTLTHARSMAGAVVVLEG